MAAARALLGDTGRSAPFLRRILARAGPRIRVRRHPYDKALHRLLKARRRLIDPHAMRPGDLVFFARTSDLNGNGRPDDGVTWGAVVEVLGERRVVFIARRAGRVRRMAMSLADPRRVRDGALVLNTRLVRWPGSSRALTAGECFVVAARP